MKNEHRELKPKSEQSPQSLFEIRLSSIHDKGAFALQFIPNGMRIIEYTGEPITPQEADVRYNDEMMEHPHTFLFTVDKQTVIDAAQHGNEARYLNHISPIVGTSVTIWTNPCPIIAA